MRALVTMLICVAAAGCRSPGWLMTEPPPIPPIVDGDGIAPLITAPAPGLPVSILPVSPTKIEIFWQNDPTAKDQLLSLRTANGAWTPVPGATSSPVTITASQPSEIFKMVRNAPLRPANVIVFYTADEPTMVRVTWSNACVNCDAVIVSRSNTGQVWAQIVSLPSTATNYTDRAGGLGYYYTVQASKNSVKSY